MVRFFDVAMDSCNESFSQYRWTAGIRKIVAL